MKYLKTLVMYVALYSTSVASPLLLVVLPGLLGSDSQQSIVVGTGRSVRGIQRVGEQSVQLGKISRSYTHLSCRSGWAGRATACEVARGEVVGSVSRLLNALTG